VAAVIFSYGPFSLRKINITQAYKKKVSGSVKQTNIFLCILSRWIRIRHKKWRFRREF